jgi:2-phospho-L-lactate transferase/gluconeogenesis factor (CofD/UPF0052 family)
MGPLLRPPPSTPTPSPRAAAPRAAAAAAPRRGAPAAAAAPRAPPPAGGAVLAFAPPPPGAAASAAAAMRDAAGAARAPLPLEEPKLVVFSGGTAFNSVAAHVRALTTRVAHVLPVSDDGGSTAEIVRVLGGPAVGDIRSRCLRLADAAPGEAAAVAALLAHRLPGGATGAAARAEWAEILEGAHPLWAGVSEPYKHTIRAFLVHFHSQVLRHASERFDFRAGSVGNFFFAGARLFFRSLEAAIFLFSRVARIPEGSLVLPAVCTEGRLSLAAELEDGRVILGQSAISHPPGGGGAEPAEGAAARADAGPASPCEVDKARWAPLPSPVRRVFYLAAEGERAEHEVCPPPNPRVLAELAAADAVVYGMGSLYTSLAPSLVLRGVGEAVAARRCPKILLLNGGADRETSAAPGRPGGGAMGAAEVVAALAAALNRAGAAGRGATSLAHAPGAYVTAVLAPAGGPVAVDAAALRALGVAVVREVAAERAPGGGGGVVYDPDALVAAIAEVVRGGAGVA